MVLCSPSALTSQISDPPASYDITRSILSLKVLSRCHLSALFELLLTSISWEQSVFVLSRRGGVRPNGVCNRSGCCCRLRPRHVRREGLRRSRRGCEANRAEGRPERRTASPRRCRALFSFFVCFGICPPLLLSFVDAEFL